MANKRVLAFDFGASSGRAMLGSLENGRLQAVELHRFSNDPVVLNGTMYWDILRLWFEIKQSISLALQNGPIDAIGIDTWGVDFGLLDQHGDLLQNPVHYRDLRTKGIPEQVFALVPRAELYRRTGIQYMRINTLYQLYYLKQHRPELLAQAQTLLPVPDLFAYFLTGVKRAEATFASTTNMLNPQTGQWDTDLLQKLGLPIRLLPQIVQPGTVYGLLSDKLCDELGCPPVPVIAVCTHDTASAVVSAPAKEDFVYISCGTWSLFGTELPQPLITPASEAYNYTNEGGYNRTIRFLRNIMGLWLIQESRRQWKREGQDYSFADLERLALEAPAFRSFIDCDDPVFETAGDLPGRVRQYCEKTGQPVPQSVGEVIRCIYESLAMKYKDTFNGLKQLTGVEYETIHMLGGGIKDTLLCSMTADATGATVLAGPAEATVMGNIAVQLIALGELEGLSQARQMIRESIQLKSYLPKQPGVWDAQFQNYLRVTGQTASGTPECR